MGLMVNTQDVEVSLGGHPVSVRGAGASGGPEGPAAQIVLDIGERSDGAVGSQLLIEGDPDQLQQVFLDALNVLSGNGQVAA